jgi:hypothetical protein
MVIRVREGNLYRMQGKHVQDLVHDSESMSELGHMMLGHLHCKEFPITRRIVTVLPKFSVEKQGVCIECTLVKKAKDDFPSSESRYKVILDIIH